jgi:Bacterial PH domain
MTATTLPPGVTDVAREPARARVRGVSEALPPGERILWEGAPNARALARHLFFIRPLSAYLGAMVLWWVAVNRGQVNTEQFWATLGIQLMLVGGVVGGAWLLARAIAQGTTYAITDRRIVMRFGVIFPLTINVPLHYVEGASAREFPDRTGQIAVQLTKKESIAWIVLFPHVRPWKFSNPEPLLRGLTDPVKVGEVLRAAVLAVPAKVA